MLYDVSVYKQYIECLKKVNFIGVVLLIAAFSVEMAAIFNIDFQPLKAKFESANIDIRIQ